MLIAFAIVAAVLVLSVLGYIGYKAYKLHKRYQAATTMDISQYMTGETERTIEQTITSLKHQNLIDNSNEALYRKVLTDNLAWFAKNGTGSADEFRNRILATADSLKHLLVHEQVIRNLSFFFRVANIEYGRTHTLSFAEDVINSWVAKKPII